MVKWVELEFGSQGAEEEVQNWVELEAGCELVQFC